MPSPDTPTVAFLEAYGDAWNAHDVDRIMAAMTEDCIFETGGGSEPWGARYQGAAVVRARFEEVWGEISDVRFDDARHFIGGDRGCSEWILRGTRTDGKSVDVAGCDLFTFRGGKIWIKSSFLKVRR